MLKEIEDKNPDFIALVETILQRIIGVNSQNITQTQQARNGGILNLINEKFQIKTINTLRQFMTYNILNVKGYPLQMITLFITFHQSKMTRQRSYKTEQFSQLKRQNRNVTNRKQQKWVTSTFTLKNSVNAQEKRDLENPYQKELRLMPKATNQIKYSPMQRQQNGNQTNLDQQITNQSLSEIKSYTPRKRFEDDQQRKNNKNN
ncbi:hypothetical protein OXYTRIMIC_252 [Oxytricha trifallax]|uniref:Uncharacterized protein n=1 Tax=Oxytricha trifallax TaxID=1172189 RepID=A0A073HZG1_9SPIT|nr:hypothetical protein OXYTRIMIC_252 [Oxytricha trifallax]